MRDRFGTRKYCSGFTLIEVLMTMVVLAILVAIAVPTFSVWYPNYRLRSAAMDLYTNFQMTKSKAINNNREYAVVFNLGGGSYQIVSGGNDGSISSAGDNVVEETITLSKYESGVNYGPGSAVNNWNGDAIGSSVTFGGNQEVFTGRGTANSNGTVYVQNKNNVRAYAVTGVMSGFIKMRKWNGAAWQ